MPRSSKRAQKLNHRGRRRRRNRLLALLLASLILAVTGIHLYREGLLPIDQAADTWSDTRGEPQALVMLPEDDGPHDNYTEWWYYNGHLSTLDGRHISFHYVIFMINHMAGFTIAHASFLDHALGKHYTAQHRTAGQPTSGHEGALDLATGNWRLVVNDGQDYLRVNTPDFAFDLHLVETTPPVLHGGTGLLDFKEAGTSYYYSRPRMRVTGTAGTKAAPKPVTGEAWFDHQWGDFRVTALGWNWFAIQLDDGRDLMIFELFTPGGETVTRFGTLSGQGRPISLADKDFSVKSTKSWESPTTHASYPMGWRIDLPAHGISIEAQPISTNAEFDGRMSSSLVYWEGPVVIQGSHEGKGFVELSGYATKVKQ